MACNNTTIPTLFSLPALSHVTNACSNLTTLTFDNVVGLALETASAIFILDWPDTLYRGEITISRFLDYKVFLVQLISQLPRPELGWSARIRVGRWNSSVSVSKWFAVLHLCADPVDSMAGYIFTLQECRAKAREAVELLKLKGVGEEEGRERRARVVVLVYLSCRANGWLVELPQLVACEIAFQTEFEITGRSLGACGRADLVPVWTAILGFCANVLQKFIYTLWLKRGVLDDLSPQHINVWSLSSSLVMIHVMPNVLLASLIGAHSSSPEARAFLQDLEKRIENRRIATGDSRRHVNDWLQTVLGDSDDEKRHRQHFADEFRAYLDQQEQNTSQQLQALRPHKQTRPPPSQDEMFAARIDNGGMPGFRPTPDRPHAVWYDIVSLLIVLTPVAGGTWLASLVPPEGTNCRTWVKLVMGGVYLVKYAGQVIINRNLKGLDRFKATAVADASALAFIAFIIVFTQAGALNLPYCYTFRGIHGGLVVVPLEKTFARVQERLQGWYPGLLFGFLGLQIVVCAVMHWFFRGAEKVHLQEMASLPVPEDAAAGVSGSQGSSIGLEPLSLPRFSRGTDLARDVFPPTGLT